VDALSSINGMGFLSLREKVRTTVIESRQLGRSESICALSQPHETQSGRSK
jgi:hypothetical protein